MPGFNQPEVQPERNPSACMISSLTTLQRSLWGLVIGVQLCSHTPASGAVGRDRPQLAAGIQERSAWRSDRRLPLLISASANREWMEQAHDRFQTGDFAAAIALWTQVIMANPSVEMKNQALINRAKAYLIIAQPGLALLDLEACSFAPVQVSEWANLWLLKGTSLLQMKRYNDSIQAFNTAERVQKRNPLLYANRAVAYQSLGKLSQARSDLLASIALHPNLASYYNLAVLERYSGNSKACTELLDQIIQKSPSYAQAYLQRGLCAASQGRHELAIADMLRVLRLDPNNAEAIEQLGMSMAAAGRSEPARTYLLKAASMRLAMGQVDAYQRLLNRISQLGSGTPQAGSRPPSLPAAGSPSSAGPGRGAQLAPP